MITLDRIRVVTDGRLAPPGNCAICGRTSGTFVEFGLDLDFYGTVYLCMESCLVQLTNTLGFYSPRQWNQLTATLDTVTQHANSLMEENTELRRAVSSFTSVLDQYDSSGLDAALSLASEIRTEKPEHTEPDSPESAEPPQGLIEQATEPGPSDLQHDDSLDELLTDSI